MPRPEQVQMSILGPRPLSSSGPASPLAPGIVPSTEAVELAQRTARANRDNAAMALLDEAFRVVEANHGDWKHRWGTKISRSVSQRIDAIGSEDMAKLGITGAAAVGGLVAASILTGGAALGAAIAIGGAAYAIKKGIERYHSYERNAQLRHRWIQLSAEYRQLAAPEQAAKRTKLAEATTADAKDCIRKCVVHLRKAVEHYNTNLKNPAADAVTTCDAAVARAKPIFKFIHEYDKFRSYLLPNLIALQTMLEDYQRMTAKWRETLTGVEGKLKHYMQTAAHSRCETCFGESRRSAAVTPTSTPNGLTFDIAKMLEKIPEMFTELCTAVADSKARTRNIATTRSATVMSQGQLRRWERFRADLMRRYDEPSRGRQVRHFVTNRNLATDKSEKAVFIISNIIDVGSSAGNPFLTGVISSVASGAVTAGETVTDLIQGAAIGGAASSATGTDTLLGRPAKVDERFASDEQVKNAFKGDAIATEYLITKIGTHWQEGMDSLDNLPHYYRKHINDCDEAVVMASHAAEFVHHFRKAEKYLLAYYVFVMRLMDMAKQLAEVETVAYNRLEALKPLIAYPAHPNCSSVCYGPKVVTSGVFSRTVTGTIDHEPKKPL